ncbi:hypothetical protein HDZ31DRAFT_38152 [Schizophyllum fasciatum]
MHVASIALFVLAFPPWAYAGSQNKWESCSQGNNRLQIGTYQFYSDCNSHTYCASNGTCMPKGCRRDLFPLGYGMRMAFSYDNPDNFPPLCNRTTFCPDEEDACQPLLRVDSACQLNRDDQCEAPPHWRQLADHSGMGRNHNGTVCLHNVCMWANVTTGQPCVVENTAYIAYTAGGEFAQIVSRDNCRKGNYCDSEQLVCMSTKDVGEGCTADKECESYNCLADGKCGDPPSAHRKLALWVYIVIGGGILVVMIGVLVGLCLLHRKQSNIEREKRMQYWREQASRRVIDGDDRMLIDLQSALHENVKQARHNTLLASQNGSEVSGVGTAYSDDSHAPILRHKASSQTVVDSPRHTGW